MIDDILIALHEAVANALIHSGASSDVAVRMRVRRTSVVVEVVDHGRGIDPSVAIPPRPPGLTAEGGRGLFMIWSLMSSVRLAHASGTHLVMVKELYPAGHARAPGGRATRCLGSAAPLAGRGATI